MGWIRQKYRYVTVRHGHAIFCVSELHFLKREWFPEEKFTRFKNQKLSDHLI